MNFKHKKIAHLGEYGAMADSETLLSICDRVHIVLTRKDTLGEIHLVSSHFLEWRQVLCAPANKTNRILELNGIGNFSFSFPNQ